MTRFLVSVGLLASAFSPLTVTLALVVSPFRPYWINGVLALALALPIGLIPLVIRASRGFEHKDLVPTKVRHRDIDNLSLISSFILPISVALFAPDSARTPASIVVLALLVLIYWRAELLYLNPVLLIIGYHLYSIEQESGAEVFLLSRRRSMTQTGGIRTNIIANQLFIDQG